MDKIDRFLHSFENFVSLEGHGPALGAIVAGLAFLGVFILMAYFGGHHGIKF